MADRRCLVAAVFRRPCIARGSGGLVFRNSGIKNRRHGELVEPSTINWPILAERSSRGFCATFSAARPTRESHARAGFSGSCVSQAYCKTITCRLECAGDGLQRLGESIRHVGHEKEHCAHPCKGSTHRIDVRRVAFDRNDAVRGARLPGVRVRARISTSLPASCATPSDVKRSPSSIGSLADTRTDPRACGSSFLV